ncbi:MAG: hypothetical protein AAB738_01340 [Patescibacteria group bacterium]
MNRRLKQLIYGFFYFLLLAFIGWGFYLNFIKADPTCFDKTQNQNEEEIDCGGPCSLSCFPAGFSNKLEIIQQKIFRLDSGHVSLFAEVKNPNADFAAKNFKYTLNAYDNSDKVIVGITGDLFLYAGETGYILAPNLEVGSSSPSRLEVILDKAEWVKSDDFKKPEISIEGISFSTDNNQIKISGSLANQSIWKLNEIKIIAIFNGRFGKPVGASETELPVIAPNTREPFAISHPFLADVNLPATHFFIRAKSE